MEEELESKLLALDPNRYKQPPMAKRSRKRALYIAELAISLQTCAISYLHAWESTAQYKDV